MSTFPQTTIAVNAGAESREFSLGLPAVPFRAEKKFSKVLLLDGYSTRTLACVRSWGTRGVPFAVGGETRWDMSLSSRYARETFVYTSPKRDVAKFIEDVNRLCIQYEADCVFPTSEAGIMACNKYRDELRCVPLIPSDREIQTMFSKAITLRLAESVGIATPKTVHITSENSESINQIAFSFPVAIKSDTSETMHAANAETSEKTAYVYAQADLERECRARLAKGQSVLAQEFIDGYGVGISGLFAEGRPVAVLGHRRIRESNPFGGPSALAETIELEPELLGKTLVLMSKIGVTGPAMVEYKIDRRSGRAYLMEINGRFWGTVLLAPAAGLDLPYLYWKMLNSMEILPEETRYKVGIRGRYLLGDTKCLFISLKGKPKSWPGEFAGRWAGTEAYLASFFDSRTKELLFANDDPMPFFARIIQDLA